MNWRIIHREVTGSTNRDARGGAFGDVFVADFQTAGRGRLDHKWISRKGENLMMSAVVDVGGMPPEHVATFPLVVGLSVCESIATFLPPATPIGIKWPNDVLVGGRKIAGILCELDGESIIAGVGVNVRQRDFPSDISDRATSLALLGCQVVPTPDVLNAVLSALGSNAAKWRTEGFAPLLHRIEKLDCLKGQFVSVLRTDDDTVPATGLCEGISNDGSLVVAGEHIYAGEAHVLRVSAEG